MTATSVEIIGGSWIREPDALQSVNIRAWLTIAADGATLRLASFGTPLETTLPVPAAWARDFVAQLRSHADALAATDQETPCHDHL